MLVAYGQRPLQVNDLKGMIEGGLSSDFAWTTEVPLP